jgi:hypothetical protein
MNKLLVLIFFIGLTISASAEKKTPTEKAKGKTEEMQQNLQLALNNIRKFMTLT